MVCGCRGVSALGVVLSFIAIVAARADDHARIDLLEENDSLYFHTDKHYTQGLRLSYLAPSVKSGDGWDRPFDYLAAATPLFAPAESDRRYVLFLGQSIFTPENLTKRPPDPRDRPYAGWLYGGVSLLQKSGGDMLENLELELGIIGPGAAGKVVQNDWHQFIGIHEARGWSNQLQNEPGGVLSYERLWRITVLGSEAFGVDIVPQAGATIGNVFDYVDAGGTVRIGSDLGADYGQARVRPALSGTDYFDSERAADGLGGYFFVGVQGRAVAHNVFLDGNNFRTSPSVSRKVLVADLQSGVALLWSRRVRLDLSVVRRTDEFEGQRTPDVVGTMALSFSL
jgi:lipid A 3-O-deacylase